MRRNFFFVLMSYCYFSSSSSSSPKDYYLPYFFGFCRCFCSLLPLLLLQHWLVSLLTCDFNTDTIGLNSSPFFVVGHRQYNGEMGKVKMGSFVTSLPSTHRQATRASPARCSGFRREWKQIDDEWAHWRIGVQTACLWQLLNAVEQFLFTEEWRRSFKNRSFSYSNYWSPQISPQISPKLCYFPCKER